MNTLDAIADRRSIRKFKAHPISEEALEAILKAALQAPSGKNQQPWRFVVVREDRRAEMVAILRDAVASQKAKGEDTGSAAGTANAMEQAPVTVFVYDAHGAPPWLAHSIEQGFSDLVNIQSIGAAIQNMLLAAQELGLGSLWICDVLYAYEELTAWLEQEGALIAAVSLGYADESPGPRPRKTAEELVRWM